MSFISYAQNFEDIILWRALRHVEKGVYIDVGAQDPLVDSVSRAFYDQGWRGIHVEPVPQYAERLRRDRPDEVVLQAALGASEGTVELNVIPNTGLSTAIDATAQRHHEAGFETQRIHVPLLTMKSAFGMLEGRDVHWLKIDVEGFEAEVLRGWDSVSLRPWVMVIEATVPGSTQTDYDAWEPIVIRAGYRFVYFDGLNRFYVADEHAELVPAFGVPPNVFDDVQLSGKGSWGLCRQVEAALDSALEQAQAALGEQDTLRAQAEALTVKLTDLEQRTRAERATLCAQNELALSKLAELEGLARMESEARRTLETQLNRLEVETAQLHLENEEGRRRIVEAHAQTHEWWSVADRLSREIRALHASTSWRITAPLRRLACIASGLFDLPSRGATLVNRGVRATARPVVVWGLRTVLARPQMRADAARMLEGHPQLKHRLRQIASRAGLLHVPPSLPTHNAEPVRAPELTQRASRLYGRLTKYKQIEKS